MLERRVLAGALPGPLHGPDGLGNGGAVHLDQQDLPEARVDVVDGGIDRRPDRAQREVGRHAHDLGELLHRDLAGLGRLQPADPGVPLAHRVGRMRVAKRARGGLVDHERRLDGRRGRAVVVQHHVLPLGLGEEATGDGLNPVQLEEADIDGPLVDGLHRGAADGHAQLEDDGLVGGHAQGHRRAAGHPLHPGHAFDLLPERGAARRPDLEDLAGVELQGVVQGEAGLPIDRGRHHDEADQDGELAHHQHLAHGG